MLYDIASPKNVELYKYLLHVGYFVWPPLEYRVGCFAHTTADGGGSCCVKSKHVEC